MEDKLVEIKTKRFLRGCPKQIDRYIVIKNNVHDHYFFGHYKNKTEAEEVAKQIKGEVVERV